MDLMHSFGGLLEVEIVSADVPFLIISLNHAGIALYRVLQSDILTVRAQIKRKDYDLLKKVVTQRGGTVRVIRRKGLYWHMKRISTRPMLVLGLVVLLAIAMYLPGKVLFVYVDGNQSVPAKLIIEKAQTCGITFGATRRLVRSEAVKNQLLAALPQLQWAGVNTYGCTAVISVVERSVTEPESAVNAVSSIVASRDGIIQSLTVTKGTSLCKNGQAVKAGQVLVSGYTNCGLMIRATRAEAEVYAQTKHQLSVVTPIQYRKKGTVSGISKKFGIKIGKCRINFFKDSGILDTTCDKMYEEKYLTLPGGFVLPVAIVIETWTTYDDSVRTVAAEENSKYLCDYAADYLQAHMIGGSILSGAEYQSSADGVYTMQGDYECLEMIGQIQKEEIIGYNGKTD